VDNRDLLVRGDSHRVVEPDGQWKLDCQFRIGDPDRSHRQDEGCELLRRNRFEREVVFAISTRRDRQ
jgi:hypothetical protein